MCGASDQEDEGDHKPKNDRDSYILDPFPNDKFVLDAWMDILATIDVCVNEVNPTVFCDKEGYDLIPFQMVLAINELPSQQELKSLMKHKKMGLISYISKRRSQCGIKRAQGT